MVTMRKSPQCDSLSGLELGFADDRGGSRRGRAIQAASRGQPLGAGQPSCSAAVRASNISDQAKAHVPEHPLI